MKVKREAIGADTGTVSKKAGTPRNVLINSNLSTVEGRMIRQGDKVAGYIDEWREPESTLDKSSLLIHKISCPKRGA